MLLLLLPLFLLPLYPPALLVCTISKQAELSIAHMYLVYKTKTETGTTETTIVTTKTSYIPITTTSDKLETTISAYPVTSVGESFSVCTLLDVMKTLLIYADYYLL
jgi:hypothetical protein